METAAVYNYQDPRLYLLDSLEKKQEIDSSYSVRRWSKEMGLKSHSLLVMLLQGKRNLRIQHCEFLRKGLDLSKLEEAYFQTLIQYQNAQSLEEKKLISSFLSDMNPGHDFKSKEVSEFIVISNWIYMAILAMTELKSFKGTEDEVYFLLGGKASKSEIRSAIIRLMDLELLKWDESNKLAPTFNKITTRDDIQNEGAREYHKQVLNLAKDALEEQSLNEREFQSFTMAIPKEKIPLAKEMIRKFRAKLSKTVSNNGDYVYQTSIQFFRLTQDPKSDLFEEKDVVRGTSNLKKENKNVN